MEAPTAATRVSRPRYHYKFWAAFSVPLKANKRFLNLRDFNFVDSEPDSPDYVEIDPQYIATEQQDNRDQWISDQIERWISEHSFTADRFLARASLIAFRKTAGTSVLEAVINALDKRQLSSTSLSLDVIAELLRKRV